MAESQVTGARKELTEFLRTNGKKQKLTAEAVERLEPFFQMAEEGKYPFSNEPGLLVEAKRALTGLFGSERVKKIVPFSVSEPFPRPDWMTEEAYRASLRGSLGGSLWDSLRDSLGGRPWGSLWDSLFYYLGFVLAGDEERVARLEPLILLLAKGNIPLGEKRDEPGVWIVAVA